MIEKINHKHDRQEYIECVEELLNGTTQMTSNDLFYDRIAEENKNYEVYVYMIRGMIAATAAITYEYKLKYMYPKAYIEDVAVHKMHRGMGLGKKIVNHCIEVAEKRQCYKIVLTCKDSLISFYEQLGFKKTDNFMVR